MRDEYAAFASAYDPLTAPFFHGVRRRMVTLARGRGPVLDLCCGTGALCHMLAKSGAPALGVDASPSMLARARARPGDARFLLADASQLPLADASFAMVTAQFALHEMDPGLRAPVVLEALRVLRPGGLLAIIDYVSPAPSDSLPSEVARALFHIPERLAGARHYRCFRDFLARGGILGLLASLDVTAKVTGQWFAGVVALATVRR